MTNSANHPAAPEDPTPAPAADDRQKQAEAARRKSMARTVDAVGSCLLAILVATVDIPLGFIVLLGVGMASDGCGTGSSCASADAIIQAATAAAVLIVIALLVTVGGLIVSAAKNVVMFWAPLAGLLISGFAWIAVSSTG